MQEILQAAGVPASERTVLSSSNSSNCLDLEPSFLVCRHIAHSSSSGQGQSHKNKRACLCIPFVGGRLRLKGSVVNL